jgi:hypothetical protein
MKMSTHYRGNIALRRGDLTDEEVLDRLSEASRDLGLLFQLKAHDERVEYDAMTTTRLSLDGGARLRPFVLTGHEE